jgi:endonuclease V-like protein UPF0215 family
MLKKANKLQKQIKEFRSQNKKFKISKNLRILAIDDSPPISTSGRQQSLLIGVIYRDGKIEGVLSTKVDWDGEDSTEKITQMIKSSRFANQIQIILINSITVAGLNIIDIKNLHEEFSIPVVAVTRHRPSIADLQEAVRKLKEHSADAKERKIESIKKAGEPVEIKFKPRLFSQFAGINRYQLIEFINEFGIEPLRLAHIISSGVVSGESKGRF